jgi:hypothetical protein
MNEAEHVLREPTLAVGDVRPTREAARRRSHLRVLGLAVVWAIVVANAAAIVWLWVDDRRVEGIALCVHDPSLVGGERRLEETPVLGQRLVVAVASELLEQGGRALDVGEQEGDGPAGELGHSRFLAPVPRVVNPAVCVAGSRRSTMVQPNESPRTDTGGHEYVLRGSLSTSSAYS